MKLFEDARDREQAVLVGAAAAAIGMLISGGDLSDDDIENAFNIAERFVAKAEAHAAKVAVP